MTARELLERRARARSARSWHLYWSLMILAAWTIAFASYRWGVR